MCVNYTYKSYIRIITYHSIHVTFSHLSGVYSFFRSDLRWRLSYPKLGKGSWLPNTSRCAPSDQLSSHTSGNSQTFRTSSEKKFKWLVIRHIESMPNYGNEMIITHSTPIGRRTLEEWTLPSGSTLHRPGTNWCRFHADNTLTVPATCASADTLCRGFTGRNFSGSSAGSSSWEEI